MKTNTDFFSRGTINKISNEFTLVSGSQESWRKSWHQWPGMTGQGFDLGRKTQCGPTQCPRSPVSPASRNLSSIEFLDPPRSAESESAYQQDPQLIQKHIKM